MFSKAAKLYESTLREITEAGLFKEERVLTTPQGARVRTADHPGESDVKNFCANNYLGLAAHPRVVEAAKRALDTFGFGLSSVRFICGTQTVHCELERALSRFLGTADTILYSSCFDANAGLFETLLSDDDAVISDELNHASIIDGIRLCKAGRLRYAHGDMNSLESALRSTRDRRLRLIATDGVFSMDGHLAKLDAICDLADRHDAMVMVDDSHATGFIGPTGRGTPEQFGVTQRVDLVTGTFGKALGGASGGFTSGRAEAIALLRQRSRPYLFSNTLAPSIAATTLEVLALLEADPSPRRTLLRNTEKFRLEIAHAGFTIAEGSHPIVPIMLGDAKLARAAAAELLGEGVYVIGFSYPVVPKGMARIRVQISAAHSEQDIDFAVTAFHRVGKRLGIVS
ncbi:MAG TPA: glycine C-acetyltransferase [Polyangiaceae bacterium]|nr:glycine C-acetyltransferase [Polyangiaceae bacterium]